MQNEDLAKIIERANKLKARKENLEGQRENQFKRLETEFECHTINEVEDKLMDLKMTQGELLGKFTETLNKIRKNYGQLLGI